MALRGTLDTFALADVLRLLGATEKTGRLRITGDRGTGSVWVDAGSVAHVEANHAPHASGSVDALFELLRFQDGSFTFDAGTTRDGTGDETEVELLLSQAEDLLQEWREIEAVVPSMDLWVSLTATLPAPQLTVDQDCWRTIVAVGSGATVRRVGDELCLAELPVSRAVKDLVERGLVEIGEGGPAAASWAPAEIPATVLDDAIDEVPFEPIVIEEPEADAADEPVAEEPLEDEPVAVEPAAEEPAAEEPAAEEPAVEEQPPAKAPVAKSAARARRARVAAPPDPGLFVPLDLPGRSGPASYDKEPEPAAKAPAKKAAAPKSPAAAKSARKPLVAAADPVPSELDELTAAFPGLADQGAATDALDDEEIAKQLASLSPRAANAIRAAVAEGASGAGLDGAGDGAEPPLSRGLLLKFLSSVKS